MSPNIEEKIKNYIEIADVVVNLDYFSDNYLELSIIVLKHLQQNNLGDIPIDDLVKRLEYNLNSKEE
jgi:hypothetical protein